MESGPSFDSIIEGFHSDGRVTTAKMFGALSLKVGAKAFAMLYKGKLVVKLPRERVAGVVAVGKGDYFDPGHGRLMKEWVSLHSLGEGEGLRLAQEACDFVAGSG
jgi:hypothetical protein